MALAYQTVFNKVDAERTNHRHAAQFLERVAHHGHSQPSQSVPVSYPSVTDIAVPDDSHTSPQMSAAPFARPFTAANASSTPSSKIYIPVSQATANINAVRIRSITRRI